MKKGMKNEMCCEGGCSWPNARHNSLFATTLVILCILGATFLAALTLKTLIEARHVGVADSQERTIAVTGTSRAQQEPDRATISIGVESSAATVQEAQTQNTATMSVITAQITAAGIPQSDIQTEYYNVYQDEVYNPVTGGYEFRGWVVYQTLVVRIDKLDLVPAVLGIAGQNGATSVSGPNYEVKNTHAQKEQARAAAIADAKAEANRIARSLGARLGEVVSYEEWSGGGMYPYYERAYTTSDMGMGASVQPGTEELELNVSITYQIIQ